jgi:hypothetical protein
MPQTKGLAVFVRGGEEPLFLPLQFRVPLPDYIAVDSIPCIFHLVDLKDTYDRYVVMLATETRTRILTVHLGSIVDEVANDLPDWRPDGRERTREQSRNHYWTRISQFTAEQVRALDRICTAGGYKHLILAGSARVTSRIKSVLPSHLAAKLVDMVPASEYDRTQDVVAATLACFVDYEEQESLAKVDELVQRINRHGPAVAGTRASLDALRKGQVDVLVLAKAYQAEPSWGCDDCGEIDVSPAMPTTCPLCRGSQVRKRDLKEHLVRLAEWSGSEVETVSDGRALTRLGGVGCLLRFLLPDSYCTKAA